MCFETDPGNVPQSVSSVSNVLYLLTGPTASGKSGAAMVLAERMKAEIVSLDSMQIYRGMDIGTAKPTPEERARVPHHLIDVVDPWEEYSLGRLVEDAERAVEEILGRGKIPLLVGGTALYIKGFLKGVFEGPSANWDLRRNLRARAETEGREALHNELRAVDADAAARIHPNDLRRIVRALEVYHATGTPLSRLQSQFEQERNVHPCRGVVLSRPRADLHYRINRRVERMFEEGLVEETRHLLADARGIGRSASQALGYKQVIAHLHGELDLHDTVVAVKKGTRQLARRQLTWFRSFRDFRWLEPGPDATNEQMADEIAAAWEGDEDSTDR